MKKALNRDKKKGAVYVQLLDKGDFFNEEYTLSNLLFAITLWKAIQGVGTEAATGLMWW